MSHSTNYSIFQKLTVVPTSLTSSQSRWRNVALSLGLLTIIFGVARAQNFNNQFEDHLQNDAPKSTAPLVHDSTNLNKDITQEKRQAAFIAVTATTTELTTLSAPHNVTHTVTTTTDEMASQSSSHVEQQLQSTQTEPNKTEPNKTEPNKTEPNKTEPNKTEPNKTEPNKTEPNKTEPNKTEPVQVKPSDSKKTLRIITADSLEIRQIEGQEFIVIAGKRVELRIGTEGDVMIAKRIEYNRTKQTLTLLGDASYFTAKTNQTISGDNLVLSVAKNSISGNDVLISETQLEIRGVEVERVPGQLKAKKSSFSLCSRCGRTPDDYSFISEQLILYPGDRIITYDTQIFLGDTPVLYLPILAIPLNEPERQPRLKIENKNADGLTVEADLPFAISHNILGMSRFRYYEQRNPQIGGGLDLQVYSPTDFIDRIDLTSNILPKPQNNDNETGYDIDLSFSTRGRLKLEYTNQPLQYTFSLKREEISISKTSTKRGTLYMDFGAKVSYPRLDLEMIYYNRFGPALDPQTISYSERDPYQKAELTLDPKVMTTHLGKGEISADFKFTAGYYSGRSNALSRLASARGKYISTSRLESINTLGYTLKPWESAEITFANSFQGRYYGTGARVVSWLANTQFHQTFGPENRNSFTVGQYYNRKEGVNPFAFDSSFDSVRLFETAPFIATLKTVPVKDTTFSLKYRYDLIKPKDRLGGESDAKNPTFFELDFGIQRAPVNYSFGVDLDLAKRQLSDLSYSLTLSDPEAAKVKVVPAQPAVPATPTTPAIPARPAHTTRSSGWPVPSLTLKATGGYSQAFGIKPIQLTATLAKPDMRTNSFSVHTRLEMEKKPFLNSIGLDFSATSTYDVVLNPLSFTGSETISFNEENPNISGRYTVNWRDLDFSTNHRFNLRMPDNSKSNGNINFSVGNTSGSAQNWKLNYGGAFDLKRFGFVAPVFTGVYSNTEPGKTLKTSASFNVAGLDQKRNELGSLSIETNWQHHQFAIGGRATYRRHRSGKYPEDKYTDVLVFDPLHIGIGVGESGQRPSGYLTASLRQTFQFTEGAEPTPQPLTPVLGMTIDRCCWAMRGEIDLVKKRFSVSIGLPGQYNSLFELGQTGIKSPLWPFDPQ